jgi:hypothetical protein
MPPLLTLKDTAARLRTTGEQVKGLVRDGKLKAINVGRGTIKPRYRFAEADIEDFERQHRIRQEPKQCLYTKGKGRRITSLIAGSKVIGLEALRRQRTDAKRKR